jgi:hypothetical protein
MRDEASQLDIDPGLKHELLAHYASMVKSEAREAADLDLLAGVLSGHGRDPERQQAAESLSRDIELAEGLLILTELEREHRAPALRTRRWRRRLTGSLSVLVAALIGAVIVFSRSWTQAPYVDDSLTSKGAGDTLAVAVEHDGQRFQLSPGQQLVAGDRIGFFYSSARPGYVAILTRDSGGEAALLFPADGDKSAPVRAGNRLPVPDGAVASEGAGCEWFVAFFADRPFDTEEARRTLAGAEANRQNCDLLLHYTNARSTVIFPVRR